jgi:GalNAc-alpha-(1->4)-GalNAc-alpha-(1->3)-diNAcBac-PP-undecaprenol alpha-1,4-N-acetyl-D-galactosaminyltransferase
VASLRAGGSERVLSGLTSGLVERGFACTVICLQPAKERPFYPLDERVQLQRLDSLSAGGAVRWPRALWRLRRALRAGSYDGVLAFTTVGGVLASAALFGSASVPLVIAERTDPVAHGARIGWLARQVRAASYARADCVVVQTEQARLGLAAVVGEQPRDDHLQVIGNPVHIPDIQAQPGRADAHGRFHIAAAGRLVPDKGMDQLLAAFARLASRFPDWDLVIYGDGPLKADLTNQAVTLSIEARVTFAGTVPDLNMALQRAHVFALPSRLEGFANALAEAGALGLPMVAFADVGGVAELIVPGATGLVSDPANAIPNLTDQLGRLMADPILRDALGRQARRHMVRFSPQAHDEAWARLITEVVATRSAGSSAARRHHVRDHRALAPH